MEEISMLLVGAIASVIGLVTLGKLSRQLDRMGAEARALRLQVLELEHAFKDHGGKMERGLSRLVAEPPQPARR